jgi:hypothetical protein
MKCSVMTVAHRVIDRDIMLSIHLHRDHYIYFIVSSYFNADNSSTLEYSILFDSEPNVL